MLPKPAAERWAANHHPNQVRLTGLLPCELWVQVVKQADHDTVWSLRNTCRYFLGLCEVADVARGRRNAWRPDRRIRSQQVPWWGIYSDWERVKERLNTTQFCAPCLQWRRAVVPGTVSMLEQQMSYWGKPVLEGVACSGCEIPHPRIFHSAPEREKICCSAGDWPTITCVGRQASMPICEHISITWDDILQFNRSVEMKRQEDRNGHQHCLVCRHPSHNEICAPNTVPRATLTYHNSTSAGHIEVRIQWEAAIVKLPVDDTTGEPPSVSYGQLQELMSSAMTQCNGSAPRLLCPHLKWDDDSLLRPFDPTYCCCLGMAIPLLHDAEKCRLRGLAGDCCLCQSFKYNAVGRLLPHTGEGVARAQLANHEASCTDCGTWYSWKRWKHPFTGEQTLWLKMGCVIILERKVKTVPGEGLRSEPNPCDMNWLGRIDPASVAGHWDRDPGLKHLTWCDDTKCATSYRGRARTQVLKQMCGR